MSNPLFSDSEPPGRSNHAQPVWRPPAGSMVTRLSGGGNSRVYLVTDENGAQYMVKRYYRHPGDPRDRLGVEFQSLSFMRRHGLSCVPDVLGRYPEQALAFYEFIPGRRPRPEEIDRNHLDALIDFLLTLHGLKGRDGSRTLPLASESCLSFRAARENLDLRLKRIEAVDEAGPEHQAMKAMIGQEYRPLFHETIRWLESALPADGFDPEAELSLDDQTLSPSDYGFHNAIRREDGRLVFLDFEYFGWDDPAKMILDFLLHPAMELDTDLKRYFLGRMLDALDRDDRLKRRLGYYQSLIGLKWVLILLNEFLQTDYGRRRFAQGEDRDKSTRLSLQLDKARRMLAWTRGVYGKTDLTF